MVSAMVKHYQGENEKKGIYSSIDLSLSNGEVLEMVFALNMLILSTCETSHLLSDPFL